MISVSEKRELSKMKRLLQDTVRHSIVDHLEIKNEMLVSHPYPCGIESFRNLIEFCDEHNLTFRVYPTSDYYQGHTFSVEIKFKVEFE